MRVARDRINAELSELAAIAIILNMDFDNIEPAELERLGKLDVGWFVEVGMVMEYPAQAERAKVAQTEAKELLMPILALAPDEEVKAEDACYRIEKLIKAINERAPKIELKLASVDHEWVFAEDDQGNVTDAALLPRDYDEDDYRPIDGLHSPKRLELLGYNWAVGREPSGGTRIPIEWDEDIYTVLRQAFENGTFTRLRVCPVCSKFFVADDNRERFCSPEHRNEHNNKKRLAGTYYQERRQKARKRQLATARRLLREGHSPKEIARKTKLSLRVLKKERVVQ